MDGASVSLRNQLELLREIARQQADDIDARTAECKWLEDNLRQRCAATASLQASVVPPVNPDMESVIHKAQMEVKRLNGEVGVWRGAAWDSATLARSSDVSIERQEEANHDLERRHFQAEKSRLERQIQDAQDRVHQLEAARISTSGAEFVDLASAQAEAGYFRDELAAERSAATLARERLGAARLEVEEERRLQARAVSQDEHVRSTTLQETALTDRRIEVEMELQRAQQAQLQSVQSTVVTLKAQVQRAHHETGELRASLAQNQETLRRLKR